MSKNVTVVVYLAAMVAIVVGVDVLFLRHRVWARLISNIFIVLVFVVFYFVFLKDH